MEGYLPPLGVTGRIFPMSNTHEQRALVSEQSEAVKRDLASLINARAAATAQYVALKNRLAEEKDRVDPALDEALKASSQALEAFMAAQTALVAAKARVTLLQSGGSGSRVALLNQYKRAVNRLRLIREEQSRARQVSQLIWAQSRAVAATSTPLAVPVVMWTPVDPSLLSETPGA